MVKSEQIKNTANIYFYSSGELIKLRALKFKNLKINNIEHIFKQMFLTKNHQIFTTKNLHLHLILIGCCQTVSQQATER